MKTLFTFLLLSIATFSQINYGLKAGMLGTSSKNVLTSFEVDTNLPTSPGIGFYLGGFLEKSITKNENLFFSTGLQFKQISTTFNNSSNKFIGYSPVYGNGEFEVLTGDAKLSIYSLQIPIMLKFKANEKISFSGGVYAGYIIKINALTKEIRN